MLLKVPLTDAGVSPAYPTTVLTFECMTFDFCPEGAMVNLIILLAGKFVGELVSIREINRQL